VYIKIICLNQKDRANLYLWFSMEIIITKLINLILQIRPSSFSRSAYFITTFYFYRSIKCVLGGCKYRCDRWITFWNPIVFGISAFPELIPETPCQLKCGAAPLLACCTAAPPLTCLRSINESVSSVPEAEHAKLQRRTGASVREFLTPPLPLLLPPTLSLLPFTGF